jgi:hypothetical protein
MAKSKKKSTAEIQRDLRELGKPDASTPPKPPFDIKKAYVRVGLVLAGVWVLGIGVATWSHSRVPVIVCGVVTALAVGAGIWLVRYMKRSRALTSILQGADTQEGRKAALERLSTEFKKDDSQAVLARAQLEMQDDPRQALRTLETIDLDKVMAPVAAQVRALRAMIHLRLGETSEARQLADALDLGKQQDAKTRATFATVASEAWARTGDAKKAVETLELFNPEEPEFAELKVQMWCARAFAYAGASDTKGVSRALKRLVEMNPNLLGMFIGQKRVHPLLEREAKQLASRSGVMQRKFVRQQMH